MLSIIFVNRDKFINWINIVKDMWSYVLAWWTNDRWIFITFLSLIPLIDIQILGHMNLGRFPFVRTGRPDRRSVHKRKCSNLKDKFCARPASTIFGLIIFQDFPAPSLQMDAFDSTWGQGTETGKTRGWILWKRQSTTHLLNTRNLLQTAITVHCGAFGLFFFFSLQQVSQKSRLAFALWRYL